jgi:hypothetical protein
MQIPIMHYGTVLGPKTDLNLHFAESARVEQHSMNPCMFRLNGDQYPCSFAASRSRLPFFETPFFEPTGRL